MRDLLVKKDENEHGIEVELVVRNGVEFIEASICSSGTLLGKRRVFRGEGEWYRETTTYPVVYGARGGEILQCAVEALDIAIRRLCNRSEP